MPNNMTWVRLYSIIVAHCDNLDDALEEIRDYADVLLFTQNERSSFIQLLEAKRDVTHMLIMAEVHRTFARRTTQPDRDMIHAIGESLCAHDCILNNNKLKDFRRILDLDNHSSSSRPSGLPSSTFGRPLDAAETVDAARAMTGYPLFQHMTVTVPAADQDSSPSDRQQSKIVTGAVDHETQYKFGVAIASTPRKFGATKPSASRSNRT
jgi:hypothetical protein